MRNAVLEALPRWRGNRYVIGVVNTPIGPCINLLRVVRIHNDRVDRDIRKIAGLVCPCERAAIGSARYLKYVAGCCRRISVESADCRVASLENCFPMIPSGEPHNKMLLADDFTDDDIDYTVSEEGKVMV